ncbi:MAG: glycosyltransferase [Blastocatellia bacterium]
MKILRIIARLNVGGPARHVVWLSSELNDGEFRSTLIAGTVPGGEQDMSYLTVEKEVSPIYVTELSRELSLKDAISLFKIWRVMNREKPDIVHTHTAKAGSVGRTAAFFYRWLTWKTLIGKPRRLRVVHTFHGHVFHSYYGRAKTRLFIIIEQILARFATDRIIAISDQQQREINGDFSVGRAEQFAVIPLGIDLETYRDTSKKRQHFRSEIKANEEETVVGIVGRLTEIKNLELFLDAASISINVTGLPRLRFVIAGDGHLRKSLEDKAKSLGISDSVIFLGNRPDIETVYAGLDIVALTSLNEGTPLSLIEAMASGRPVIATMVGGVVDLLGSVEESRVGFEICERGIGIQPGSPENFLKGLIYLEKNERLRESMAQKGRAFVENTYSKERLVNDIKSLYRGLMA